MIGGRSGRLALATAVVVVAALAWSTTSSDDERDESDDSTRSTRIDIDTPQLLDSVTAESVATELWVYGGIAGPIGSGPPMTSMVPDGWGTNRMVSIYEPDGTVRQRFLLPDLGGTFHGRVLAHGDDRLAVGSTCTNLLHCNEVIRPLLLRFSPSGPGLGAPHIVPLELPPPDGDGFQAGRFDTVGIAGDLVWLEQGVDVPLDGGGVVTVIRAVAVDVTTGAGTEVPLPEGWNRDGGMCVLGDHLYRSTTTEDDQQVRAVSLHRRPAATVHGDWETVGVLDPPDGDFSTTTRCLDELEEVVVVIQDFPDRLWTHTAGTEGFAEAAVLDDLAGADVLGTIVDDAGVPLAVAIAANNAQRVILTRPEGGDWTLGASVDMRAWPQVVGGRLVDVAEVRLATHAPEPALPTIALGG